MVHALSEIRRVLVPNGFLIDLRPLLDRWHIEVASAREARETGRMHDFPTGIADDKAANHAMATAEDKGWFIRENEAYFSYIYSWDSPKEMEEWIDDEWEGYIEIDDESKNATRSAWALGDGDTRVRVKIKMLIARWKKNNT